MITRRHTAGTHICTSYSWNHTVVEGVSGIGSCTLQIIDSNNQVMFSLDVTIPSDPGWIFFPAFGFGGYDVERLKVIIPEGSEIQVHASPTIDAVQWVTL